jgi:hypothetical protein
MAAMGLLATLAAFLRPFYRTLTFIASGAVMFLYYFFMVNWNLVAQVVLQVLGGVFFLRWGACGRARAATARSVDFAGWGWKSLSAVFSRMLDGDLCGGAPLIEDVRCVERPAGCVVGTAGGLRMHSSQDWNVGVMRAVVGGGFEMIAP